MATKVGVENRQEETELMDEIETAKVPPSRSGKMAKGQTQPNNDRLGETAKVPPSGSGKMTTKVGVENSRQEQTEPMYEVETAKVPPSQSGKMAKGQTQPNNDKVDVTAKVPPTQSGTMATIGRVEYRQEQTELMGVD